jgi:hypothetical protein
VPGLEKTGTLELQQNFPNPFDQQTTIQYAIPERAPVELKVFDMCGREVAQLVNQTQDAGTYSVNLNAASSALSPGIYYGRLRAGNNSKSLKIIYSPTR